MKVSIVIRTKNEERWISSCLRAVYAQEFSDFEVIVVDNMSTDGTLRRLREFPVKVVRQERYLPGLALNAGIRKSKGAFIVCLSGHCIPVARQWLGNLLRNFSDPTVAGVYGRQEPMAFSSDRDKRDLLITFGLDRRVQEKDSFFHNANSMLRRDLWEKVPFDEDVTNIEDRVWAQAMLSAGHRIVYDPEASVYHWHGIHHDGDPSRAAKVTRILEGLTAPPGAADRRHPRIDHLEVVALVPAKGPPTRLAGRPLLEYTIRSAREAKHVKRVVVSTDSKATARLAERLGAEVPFLRDASYSQSFVGLDKVLEMSLEQLERRGIVPDLLVSLEPTYPFRPAGLVDSLVEQVVTKGFDSVVAARREYNSCWAEEEGGIKRLDEGFVPRLYKRPIFVGLKGLGCATYPSTVRSGRLLGDRVGLFEVADPAAALEVREAKDLAAAGPLMERWWRARR